MNFDRLNRALDNKYLSNYVYTYPLKSKYDKVVRKSNIKGIMTEHINIYIHIPFCEKKCSFCDLFSIYNASYETRIQYAEAIQKEIKLFFMNNDMKNKKLDSIYFGGGTPTVLPLSCLKDIIQIIKENIDFNYNIEISTETTPIGIKEDYIQGLKEIGFNRISVGIQTLNDIELREIQRNYSAEDVLKTLDLLNKIGFDNINADLIYGIPYQTQETWIETVKKLMEQNISTITMYPLVKKNNLVTSTKCMSIEDIYLAYDNALKLLKDNNFNQFTVVSFSKKQNACLHEESFFSGNSVIGFGSSARTYFQNIHFRSFTEKNMNSSEYIQDYIKGSSDYDVLVTYLEDYQIKNKNALLGLLLGVHGAPIENFDLEVLSRLIDYELVYKNNDYVRLTPKGLKYSSTIADFLINEAFDKITRVTNTVV